VDALINATADTDGNGGAGAKPTGLAK
jgi:hypothetical protein